MKTTKLLIYSFAIMMLLISCGKQTMTEPIKPEEPRGLNTTDELNRIELDQSDDNIVSGPSVDISLPVNTISEKPEISSNINLTEWDTYMIVPGDFLISIASEEYGNFRKWQEIYSWNRQTKDEIV